MASIAVSRVLQQVAVQGVGITLSPAGAVAMRVIAGTILGGMFTVVGVGVKAMIEAVLARPTLPPVIKDLNRLHSEYGNFECKQYSLAAVAQMKRLKYKEGGDFEVIAYRRRRPEGVTFRANDDSRLDGIWAAPNFGRFAGQAVSHTGVHVGIMLKIGGAPLVFENNVLGVSKDEWTAGYEILPYWDMFDPMNLGRAHQTGAGTIRIISSSEIALY